MQDYSYDALGQLTNWTRNPGTGSQATEDYDYDSVGNRTLLTSRNNMGVVSSWRTYDIGRRANLSAGPNQLLKSLNRNALTVFNYTTSEYDPDGSMTERKLYTGGDVLSQEDQFSYSSWRGLNWKYHRSTPRPSGDPLEWEWRYRYNAMGEREQKREVLNPNGDDVASQGYKWSYYLLGGNKQQLSLWEGLQTSDGTFCSLPGGGGSYVHLYPSEYITNAGSTAGVVTKPTSTSSTQEYRIADHLGSNRVVLSGSTGAVLSKADYAPFGGPLGGSTPDRQSFIDKERDMESQLGNFGVRSYDYDAGRFTSVDPLWEGYPGLSPYNYSANSPLMLIDPTGESIEIYYTHEGVEYSVVYEYGESYEEIRKRIVGGDNDFVKSAIEAFDYIIAADESVDKSCETCARVGPADVIKSVAYDQKVLRLREEKRLGYDGFNLSDGGPIYWNPLGGLITSEGGLQTPALGLLHEFGHAASYFADPESYKVRRDMDGPRYEEWENAEEKRNILRNENVAADALGEAKRKNHEGTAYQTLGPTTTVEDPNAGGARVKINDH